MIIQVKHWGCKLLINSCPRSPHRVSLWRASGISRSGSKGVKKLVVPIHESCDARSYLRRGRIYYCKNTGWNCIHFKNHGRVCDHNSPSVHFTTAFLDWHVLISSVPVPWCLVNHFIRFQDWPHQCWTTSASKISSWFNLKNKNKCCISRVARLQLDFQGLFFQLRLPSEKSPKKSRIFVVLVWVDPWDPPAWTSFRIRPGIYCGPFLMVRSQQLPTRIVGGESKKIRLGWWLNPTHLKKICSSNWILSPNFRGANLKKMSCHHLESVASWKHGSLECYLLPSDAFSGIPGHKW